MLVGVPFVVAGAVTAVMAEDVGVALEIGIGTESPFTTRADLPAVVLATLGYMLLPALIGVVIAALIEDRVARSVVRREDLDQQISDAVEAIVRDRSPAR